MEKIKKNSSIKKMLTLTLAFMMVFTGLGIGRWGPEDAWAEGDIVFYADDQKITYARAGTNYYITVPETTQSISIVSFNGLPTIIVNNEESVGVATDESIVTDEWGAEIWDGAAYDESTNTFRLPFDTESREKVWISDSELHLTMYDSDLSLSYALYVTLGSEQKNTPPQIALGAGTSQTLYLAANEAYSIDLSEKFTDIDAGDSLSYKISKDGEIYSDVTGNTYSGTFDGTDTTLYFKANDGKADSEVYPVHLKSLIDKTALSKAILSAPTAGYYTKDDRYNGNTTSINGFWVDFQTALTAAKSVANNTSVSQTQVNEALVNLQSAIANLIPTTQVNATELYEAVNRNLWWASGSSSGESIHVAEEKPSGSTGYEDVKESNSTPESWAAYAKAKENASTLLESLYENGMPTYINSSSHEGFENLKDKVTEAAKALDPNASDSVVASLEHRLESGGAANDLPDAQAKYDLIKKVAQKYELQMENLTKEDYTEDSWAELTRAIAAAKEFGSTHDKPTAETGEREYQQLRKTYKALRSAWEGLKDAKDSITVTVTVVDNADARRKSEILAQSKVYTITLGEGERNLNYVLEKLDLKSSDFAAGYDADVLAMMFRNGILIDEPANNYRSYTISFTNSSYFNQNVVLRDGDKITLAKLQEPSTTGSSGAGCEPSKTAKDIFPAVRSTELTGTAEAEQGTPAAYTAKSMAAYVGSYTGRASALVGATVFVSPNAAEKAEDALAASQKTEIVTDENGSFSYTFVKPGYYYISVYPLGENTNDDLPGLTAGATMLVHVTETDAAGLAAARERFLTELDSVYGAYAENFFTPSDWEAVKEAYLAGKEGISKAEASMVESKEALDTAVATIEKLQRKASENNSDDLLLFRNTLAELPNDASHLSNSQTDKENMERLIAGYEAMTGYAKGQLTTGEYEKYTALVAVYGTDGSTLPDPVKYSLTLKLKAENEKDLQVLETLFKTLREDFNLPTISLIYGYDEETWNPIAITEAYPHEYIDYNEGLQYLRSSGKLYGISDQVEEKVSGFQYVQENSAKRHFYINGKEYELKSVTMNGETLTPQSGAGHYWEKMPSEDVVLTATYGAVENAGAGGTLSEAQQAAKDAIAAAFSKYEKNDYSHENWEALNAAKTAGESAVDEASDADAAAKAKEKAIAAMAAVKTIAQENNQGQQTGGASGVKLPDYGKVVGKVHIIVENQTFKTAGSNGAPAWYGTLIDGNYDLCENDTMMTAVLKALQLKGCNWSTGSQGVASSWDDYDIGYIASIKVPEGVKADGKDFVPNDYEKRLGEFSGESGSGWMGTLNDWFTNYGFDQFSYKNGELKDGDEIHIMFTQNLGEDLGGTWGNSDTGLKSLSISKGKLMPSFDSSTLNYGLILGSSSENRTVNLTVTPAASNKNYQVRTYLNKYNSDSALYRRTSVIPVKAGDTLYVGCGEYSWPSMNNQGAEARAYTGTKYTIKVYQTELDYVKDALKTMVSADDITYTTYKKYKEEVSTAGKLYNSLDTATQKTIDSSLVDKLTAAEKQIQFYSEIDDAKDKFAALKTTSSESAAKAAYNAYKKLNDEQKKYITVADTQTYNQLAEKYKMTAIAGSTQMPESNVTTNKKDTTAVVEPVISEGAASVTVDKDTLAEIKKQALKAKSDDIILQVSKDVKGQKADSVTVNVDVSTLKEIAKNQDVALTVSTEAGTVKLDSSSLKDALTQARGSELTIRIEKKNASDSQKKLLGDTAAMFELTVKSGAQTITKFAGKVTVRLEIPSQLLDKKVACAYVEKEDTFTQMPGSRKTIGNTAYYVFETDHSGSFALVDGEALGLEVGDDETNIERTKELVSAMSLKARSSKTSKKNIKVSLTVGKDTAAAIKEIKEMGYTVKYKYYRSTKKASKYQARITKTNKSFINTAGKKGTRYYYKARIQVYDKDGKLVAQTLLKQCKYAVRTWTK